MRPRSGRSNTSGLSVAMGGFLRNLGCTATPRRTAAVNREHNFIPPGDGRAICCTRRCRAKRLCLARRASGCLSPHFSPGADRALRQPAGLAHHGVRQPVGPPHVGLVRADPVEDDSAATPCSSSASRSGGSSSGLAAGRATGGTSRGPASMSACVAMARDSQAPIVLPWRIAAALAASQGCRGDALDGLIVVVASGSVMAGGSRRQMGTRHGVPSQGHCTSREASRAKL